jgi:hypothetical protein
MAQNHCRKPNIFRRHIASQYNRKLSSLSFASTHVRSSARDALGGKDELKSCGVSYVLQRLNVNTNLRGNQSAVLEGIIEKTQMVW